MKSFCGYPPASLIYKPSFASASVTFSCWKKKSRSFERNRSTISFPLPSFQRDRFFHKLALEFICETSWNFRIEPPPRLRRPT